MSVGVSVKDFIFVFDKNGVIVSHKKYGLFLECYRSQWREIMFMPDSHLPDGFNDAFDVAFDKWRVVATEILEGQ